MAGGDFANTDFAAAAPFTYNHDTGGGAYNDRTVGDFNDITEQLEGGEFVCGDIVTYLFQITMEGTVVTPVQTARFDLRFLADSTGQSGAALADIVNVQVNYGQVENGDDGSGVNPGAGFFGLDSGINDDGGSTATLISESLTGPLFQAGSELLGTVEVTDLEAGETVVVRVDVLLECDPGSNPTGNLQGQLDAGLTDNGNGFGDGDDDVINTGQQTIPFLKIGELEGAGDPLLDIQKTVTTQGGTFDSSVEELTVTSGDTVRYYYEVINDGTADLFDLDWTDDAGTLGNTADDFTLGDATILKVIDFDGNEFTSGFGSLYGDLDGDADADDLASGATVIFYKEVQLSAQGTVINTVDAIGNNGASGGNFAILEDSDTATVNVEGTPAIGITKTADVTSVNAANQVITYTYTVSNDGDVPLTGITLSDDNFTPGIPGDDFSPTLTDDGNGDAILDVNESWTYTASYTVTQADLDDGSDLVNVATANSNETAPETDHATVDVVQNPNFTIVKEADVDSVDADGDVINYTYTITNTGNQSLTGVTLSDDNFTAGNTGDDFNPTLSTNGNGDAVLDVGESWTYTASYTATQDDIDNGADLVNVATADTDQTDPKTDNETVDVVQDPNLSVVKNADVASVDTAGDVINYTYTVTNTGNQTLTNVTLTDDNFTNGDTSDDFNPTFDSSSDNGNGVLDVGESWTYTASHTVTQAEIDSGADLVNVATAESDQTQPKTDDAVVDVLQDADFLLTKDANVSEVSSAGEVITYTYTLENTGTVSLTNVTLSDDNFTPANTSDDFTPTLTDDGNGDTTLDVGETWTYTASYTVTQDDIDSGDALVNVATGDTDQTDPRTDNETVTVNQNPNFTIVKEADVTTVDEAGDVINYTYTVTNTGNQTLTNVTLTDDNFTNGDTSDDFNPTFDSSSDNGNGVLDVGESWTYTASHTVTQDEIDSGADLVNVATADTAQTDPKTDDQTVDVVQTPNLSISKVADVTEVDGAGDQIVYTYTVQNTGNVTLENVSVTDDNFTPSNTGDDFAITLDKTTLAPGETATGTFTYTVTQADIDSGADLVNVATADSDETDPKEDPETVDVIQNPSLSILKEADTGLVNAAGQVITYTYTVTNTGNQSLTNVTLSDDNFTNGDTSDDFNPTLSTNGNGDAILDVGETWTYTATHTVTQAEIDSGAALVNVATADSDQIDPQTDNENVGILQDPSLSISKEANVTEVDGAGDQIVYTYTVQNTGNVTLENVTLTDDNFTNGDTSDDFNPSFNGDPNNNGKLDVGETWTYTANYTVTQADIDSGADLVNVATADSNRTDPISDDETVDVIQNPNLSILKEANVTQVDGAGDQIIYTYTVQNTGNVTLENVSVSDDNFTPSNTGDDFAITLDTTTLAPGETAIGTYTYTVTQANIDSGLDLVNVAIADSDQTDPKTDNETVDVLEDADFLLTKEADVIEVTEVGQVITYTYTATNSGNQTLTGFTLSDDNFTPGDANDDFSPTLSTNGNGDANLDVGESWTYTANYTVTQADFDSGLDLVNVATADTDQTDPKEANETVNVIQDPSITLDKVTSDGVVTGDNIGVSAGTSISWIYTVTNDGNLNLSNISLTDDEQGSITILVDNGDGDAILAPNETWVYELSGTAMTGSYDNIGTVTGDHSGGQGQVQAIDDSSYTGIVGPGVRTPGFWKNWTEVWDGDASNDSRFAGRSGFPSGDILLAPYSASPEAPQVIDPVTGDYAEGILVGDYNRNGMTDGNESTIFYSLTEAQAIVGANNKIQKNDKRWTLDRSLVASWLNYTAFNPAPTNDIDNGIAWIQEHTPDENGDGIGDGNLISSASDYAVPASSDFWNQPSPIVPNGGELIHTNLDNYNNFGLS